MAQAQPSSDDISKLRDEADRRLILMRNARTTYRSTWQEVSHYIMPTRGRYFNVANQASRGRVKGPQIVDRTATVAVSNLAAFLMAGITRPARDWFKLSTNSDALNDDPQVKTWLAESEKRLMRVFASGNFYNAMAQIYEEIAGFGTGACIILQDYDDVARFYPLTAGEFYLAQNARGEVDTLFREYVQNIAQLVERFGLENCSETVKSLWDSRSLTQELPIVHAIIPNASRIHGAFGWRGMPWIGVYYEYGNRSQQVLAVEGYARKPFIAPRWHAISNDVYGTGPAEDALPDVKSLQVAQLRLAEAVDKFARPPMMADASMQNQLLSLIPAGVNYIPGLSSTPGVGLRPVYQTTPNIDPLQMRVQAFQDQIRKTLKNDLILMVSQDMGGVQPRTAAEINVRQQEKLLALGPVLERFHNEALDPVISTTLEIMDRGGLLPPRPPNLTRENMRISYVSVLAQAQRATQTQSIEQFVTFVGGLVGVDPAVMDNVNTDFLTSDYADLLSIDERGLNSPQQVAQIRQDRAYQQQQAAAAQNAASLAQGAKTLSDTDVGGGQNALQAMLSGVSG